LTRTKCLDLLFRCSWKSGKHHFKPSYKD